MKTIHLHGELSRFGSSFDLDVQSPAEAIRALSVQLPEFRKTIADGEWHVVKGDMNEGTDLSDIELAMAVGKVSDIHIIPAAAGSGGKFGQIVLGAVLVGAAFMTGGASMAAWGAGAKAMGALGAGLVVGGVAQMLIKPPNTDFAGRESPDQRPSFLFDGPVNTSTQGLPVPLIYGEVKTGSVVISAGMTAEDF